MNISLVIAIVGAIGTPLVGLLAAALGRATKNRDRSYNDMKEDRDHWRNIALTLTEAAQRQATVAEVLAAQAQERRAALMPPSTTP